MSESLHYFVEGVDPETGESIVYLYWKDMVAGLRFRDPEGLLEFIANIPGFLVMISADLHETYVAKQIESLESELPKILKSAVSDKKKAPKEKS